MIRRFAFAVPFLVLLAGCATLEDFFARRQAEEPPALPPLAERPQAEPIGRNRFVLESPEQSVIGEPQIVFTRAEDTFSDLAREYGLGYDELIDANPGVDPWLPGAGTPVLLPTQYVLPDVPRRGIVLNIAAKRLFYFPQAAEGEPAEVLTYPVGIGRVGWETPVGQAQVIAKAVDPVWYVPWSVQQEHKAAGDPLPPVVPPGPDNPLGRHVLQLNLPGYLIHGTNKPAGVGMRVSHGCVRLYPEDIEALFALVGKGETVTIVNEPYLAGWRDGELYLEMHPPLEDDPHAAAARLEALFAAAGEGSALAAASVQDQARALASEPLGVPVRALAGDVLELYDRARVVKNTVEPDPNAPKLAEVRALLDEAVAEDTAEPGNAAGSPEAPVGDAPAAELND